MPGQVSNYVLSQVKHALAARSVVVWFDEEGAYQGLLPALSLPNCTVVAWNGSYYEMAHKAHKPFTKLSKANRALGHTLLLYVPHSEAEATPLLEFAMAGEAFTLPLRVAAQRALHKTIPQAALADLLAKQSPTLEDLDNLAESGQPNLLQAIFPGASDTEIMVRYLTGEGVEQKIDDRGALEHVVALGRSAYGIPDGVPATSHAEFKAVLWRHLLISGLREGLGPQPPALSMTPQPAAEQYRRVADTLAALRRDAPVVYAAMAAMVAAETGAAGWNINPVAVLAGDTFAFLEEAALLQVQQLIVDSKNVAAAAALVARYLTSFWVTRSEVRMLQWRAAALAVELCETADEVSEALAAAGHPAPAAAVDAYAAPDTGWWRLDMAQRRLEAHVAHMEDEFALDKLLHHARYRYERVLDDMAKLFADGLHRRGFQFDHHAHQTDVFSSVVEPLLAKQHRVAFFLVDALRFEMGRELFATLTGTVQKAITPVVGTPPTITQVGMAALMPGAEKGVGLTVAGGKVGLAIGDTPVVGSAARRDWIKTKTGGGWAVDLTLDELVSDSDQKLRPLFAKKTLAVVRSQEIDDLGEDDYRHTARQTMTMMLGALRKGITRLAKFGFTHVVIAADHGYLFGEAYTDDRKIDPPNGEGVELHRRCWIGRHPTAPAHMLHFKAAELGLGGDLDVVVPKGLAIFKAKGGAQSYFHGGLSVQELVIPVITAELSAPAKEKVGKGSDVSLTPQKPAVTNRMFMVELAFTSMLEPTKVVQVVALLKDQEVGRSPWAAYGFDEGTQEITLQNQKPNQVFVQLSGDLEGTGSLTVQAVDPRTGLVLAQVTLPYELA